jgi:hypothetical protein
MAKSATKIPVYLEIGTKRIFACAVDWPGWSRSGRDEESALQALFDHGRRYGSLLRGARLEFQAPADVSAFKVTERLKGNTTTDFGAPDAIASVDKKKLDQAALRRLQTVLKACWRAFDAAVAAARGKALRKGPRGGGRAVTGIAGHVAGAEAGYLSALGWKFKPEKENDLDGVHKAVLEGLQAALQGEIAAKGPRGGTRWPARYFVRRAAWHVIDHIWEIEDRLA